MLLEDVERAKAQSETYSLKQKVLQGVANFVRGPVQAYALQTFGSVAAGFSAIGFVGVSVAVNHLNMLAKTDALTNTYRDELAVLLHKDRRSITADDLKNAAPVLSTNNPIRQDLETTKATQSAVQTKSVIKNLAISLAVIGFAAIGGGLVMNMMGFTIGGLALAIDLVTENTLGKWQQKQSPTSAFFVDQISSELTRGLVSPMKLMEYNAIKNPQMKEAIRQTFHADYAALSFKQKKEALAKSGQEPLLTAIAKDLNEGHIRPSELPFLLSGQDSPSTSFDAYSSVLRGKPTDVAVPSRTPENTKIATPLGQVSASELQGPLSEAEARSYTLH